MLLYLASFAACLAALCSAQELNFNQTWNLTTVLTGQAQLTQFTTYLNQNPQLFSTLANANVTSEAKRK
jgi:hypothetical protein